VNDTKDMPKTRQALLDECGRQGILQTVLKEAKASESVKPLAELMKYDELKALGGTEELRAVQKILVEALKSIYPDIRAPNEQVMPAANIGRTMQELKNSKAAEPGSRNVIVLNDNDNSCTATPLVAAAAVSNYQLNANQTSSAPDFDFRAILTSMAIPEYVEQNRNAFFLTDLTEQDQVKQLLKEKSEKDREAEMQIYSTLMGASSSGFNLAIVSGKNSKSETVHLYVLEDRECNRMVVVGPENISVQLAGALNKNNVLYLNKSDPATQEQIDKFMSEGTRARQTSKKLGKDAAEKLTSNLITAFGLATAVPDEFMTVNEQGAPMIKQGATLGKIFVRAAEEPSLYTQLVKKTAGKPATKAARAR